MLVEDFLPIYDVSDAVATVVHADAATTWNALLEADLIEVGRKRPWVAILGALRILPDILSQLIRGKTPGPQPAQLRLRDMTTLPLGQGGWVMLGERPQEEIAIGLVGKFWRPVIQFANVSRDRFREFSEPGFAKTVYSLSVKSIDGHTTLLSGVMRTATTDERAGRWFRWYWTLGVGSGAHVLARGLLDVVRETAEGATAR